MIYIYCSGQGTRLTDRSPCLNNVSNNWVTLLPTIPWMAWVDECLGKCEPWIPIVFCTLSSNLFVCAQQWQLADPSHILYQYGVINKFERFNRGATEGAIIFVRSVEERGYAQTVSLRCTCAHNHDTNMQWICPRKWYYQTIIYHLKSSELPWQRAPQFGQGAHWEVDDHWLCGGVCLFVQRQYWWAVNIWHIKTVCVMVALLSCFCDIVGRGGEKRTRAEQTEKKESDTIWQDRCQVWEADCLP